MKTPIALSGVTRVKREDGWHLVIELLPERGLPDETLEHVRGVTEQQADELMRRVLRERAIDRTLWR